MLAFLSTSAIYQDSEEKYNLDFTPKKITHALDGVGCFYLVDSVNLGDDHLSSCYLSLGSLQSSLVPV